MCYLRHMRSPDPVALTTFTGLCLLALSLSGCGASADEGRFFQNLAQHLSEIDIDEKPKDVALQTEEVPLREPSAKAEVLKTAGRTVVDMALEMAGKDKAPAATQRTLQLIRIVNPLDMPRPPSRTVLDTGLEIAPAPAPVAVQVPAVALSAEPAAESAATFRTIQIGSFSSEAGAQQAWAILQARYPDMERLTPVIQPVTLASGASVVRLRLGPVADEAQAIRLCAQLEITDSWCAKAG